MSPRRAISPTDQAALDTFGKVYKSLRRDGVAFDWAFRLAMGNARHIRAGKCPLYPVEHWADVGGDGVPVHSSLPPDAPNTSSTPHRGQGDE